MEKLKIDSIDDVLLILEESPIVKRLKGVSKEEIKRTKEIIGYVKKYSKNGQKDNENIAYLINLDKNIRSESEVESPKYGKGIAEHFINKKITISQIKKIINIVEKENLILTPASLCFGFKVGYRIFQPVEGDQILMPTTRHILTFLDRQLPKSYDFNKLSETFMSHRNLNLAKLYNFEEIVNKRSKYDY